MIASVTGSTLFLSDVWDSLSSQGKQELMAQWATLIEAAPESAAESIIRDITVRTEWREAWGRLEATSSRTYRLVLSQLIDHYGPVSEGSAEPA